jgi:hypothetical protein
MLYIDCHESACTGIYPGLQISLHDLMSWAQEKQLMRAVPIYNKTILPFLPLHCGLRYATMSCSSGQDAAKAAKGIVSLVGKVYYVQGGADSWQAGSPPPTTHSICPQMISASMDGPAHGTCQEDNTSWRRSSSRERCDGESLAKGMPAGLGTALEGTVQVWPESERPWHQHRQPG